MKLFKLAIVFSLLLTYPALAQGVVENDYSMIIKTVEDAYKETTTKIDKIKDLPAELKKLVLSQAKERKDAVVSYLGDKRDFEEKQKKAYAPIEKKLADITPLEDKQKEERRILIEKLTTDGKYNFYGDVEQLFSTLKDVPEELRTLLFAQVKETVSTKEAFVNVTKDFYEKQTKVLNSLKEKETAVDELSNKQKTARDELIQKLKDKKEYKLNVDFDALFSSLTTSFGSPIFGATLPTLIMDVLPTDAIK